VYIFLPIGFLILLIIAAFLQVKHTLTLPICPKCTRRRSLAGIVSFVSLVSCVVLILFAIVAGLATKSWPVFLGVAAITIAIAYFAEKYDRSVNPRYIKFTKKRVEIEVPGHGSVVMFDLASQQAGNEFY